MIINQFKRAQVVMLPTNKNSSNIAKSINQDILSLYNKNDDKYNQWINQHLYIISDDEIEDGDWFINLLDNSIHQATNWIYVLTCKKIIATTDTSLIENIEMIYNIGIINLKLILKIILLQLKN